MPQVGTQITRVNMASNQVITTDTIRVHSVILAYDSAGANEITFYFKTADGTSTYFLLTVNSGSSQELHITWIADKGLSIEAPPTSRIRNSAVYNPENAVITIIHSAVGI
jgi:hypothetical protein